MDEPAPLDSETIARFREWQEDSALPAVFLTGAGPAPETAGGSRIGGPVWLPAGEDVPLDRQGAPMSFLAQIDFAEMPGLDGYPDSGILQFFIARDIYFGADLNDPRKGDFRVIYRESVDGPGELVQTRYDGRNGEDYYTPLDSKDLQGRGVRLKGKKDLSFPGIFSFTLARDLPDFVENNSFATLNALVREGYANTKELHHVGGHPETVQDDWRVTGELQEFDTVLLNLWSKDGLMWGDMGQGQFLIRREDLLRREFDNVAYQWDAG